jgi:hypothetical protein
VVVAVAVLLLLLLAALLLQVASQSSHRPLHQGLRLHVLSHRVTPVLEVSALLLRIPKWALSSHPLLLVQVLHFKDIRSTMSNVFLRLSKKTLTNASPG